MQNHLTSLTDNPAGKPVKLNECEQLQTYLWAHIPLAAYMQIQVISWDEQRQLRLQAPLDVNINDKGTAFGGAISTLMTLAGWGWLWLAHREVGIDRDIVIHRSQLTYKQPVQEQLVVVCNGVSDQAWKNYLVTLERRGRSRLALQPQLVKNDASLAATM